jgi:hypothetical protein
MSICIPDKQHRFSGTLFYAKEGLEWTITLVAQAVEPVRASSRLAFLSMHGMMI